LLRQKTTKEVRIFKADFESGGNVEKEVKTSGMADAVRHPFYPV
jgi:hypothetical protein